MANLRVQALIGRLLFDHVGNAPIARADENDFIVFDVEGMGSRLRHFLNDIWRQRMELDIIGHDIADRFRGRVLDRKSVV